MFLQAVITYLKLCDIYIPLGEIRNDLRWVGDIIFFIVLKTVTKKPFKQTYIVLHKINNLRQNDRRCENHKRLSENLNGREHVGHLGANGRTLLKRTLKICVLRVRTGVKKELWPRVGSYEHKNNNWLSASYRTRKFLSNLSILTCNECT
jgi:hypothetical protein